MSYSVGQKRARAIKAKDPDHYRRIGRIGGKVSRGGGFATPIPCNCNTFHYEHVISSCAGKRGGKISRRKKQS